MVGMTGIINFYIIADSRVFIFIVEADQGWIPAFAGMTCPNDATSPDKLRDVVHPTNEKLRNTCD